MTHALKGTTVLVTGGAGFIGSHLTERLVAEGARTRVLVRYNSAGTWGWLDRSPAVGQIEVIAGDVRDRDSVRRAVEGASHVFHLAALIGIPYSYVAPASYVETNITGTLNVLQAARETGVERVIVTSTSEVYGTGHYAPMDERHPLQGQSPYSASKIAADKIAESFHRSFGVPVVTLRPFNTYGPRQSARAVIPTIISQCLAGDIVRLGSLTPTRDLNYVSDTVTAYLAAATSPGAVGETINVGTGREISIGDLAALIAATVGRPVTIECTDERARPAASEVERLVADNTLAARLLDWAPRVPLEEGLRLTIAWLKDHRDHYKPTVYAV